MSDCPKLSIWYGLCKRKGNHKIDDCSEFEKLLKLKEKKDSSSPGNVSACSDNCTTPSNQGFSQMSALEDQHIYQGNIQNNELSKTISVLRDTGSAVHAVHESLISPTD